jgi:hypothetical protein
MDDRRVYNCIATDSRKVNHRLESMLPRRISLCFGRDDGNVNWRFVAQVSESAKRKSLSLTLLAFSHWDCDTDQMCREENIAQECDFL